MIQNEGRTFLLIVLGMISFSTATAQHSTFPIQEASTSFAAYPGSVIQSPAVNGTGPNVDIAGEAAPDRQQVETTVSVDPHNPYVIAAGAQDLRLKPSEHRWHGYYRSTDGGQTWSSSLLPGYPGDTSPQGLSSPLHGTNATTDPVLAFDRFGNLYYAGIAFNVNAGGPFGNGPIGNTIAFVAKYGNDGATYFETTIIGGTLFADKEWIAVDTTGGRNDGNVYLAFDANLTSQSYYGTVFTRSINGGASFAPPFYAPSDMTGELPGITIDPSGNIYLSTVAFNPSSGIPLGYTQVTKIAPGGTSIAQTVRAVDPTSGLPRGAPVSGAQFRGFTIPQIAADANGVYLVFEDVRLGNANVYLTRSTDGGSSWISPLRLNDNLAGQHFFPTIAASGGAISVAWYDSRLNTGSTMNSLDVYFADSLDGGKTFTPNIRITNTSFNPNTVERTDSPNWNEPFMGDYFEIATTATTAHPVWADNINACDTPDPTFNCLDQDAFTSTISLADFSITAQPASQSEQQGSARNVTAILSSLQLFQGTIHLSITSAPSGLTTSPASATLPIHSTETAILNFTISSSGNTSAATYSVNLTGTTGPRSHSAIITFTVTASSNRGGPLETLIAYMTSYPEIIILIAIAGVIVFTVTYTAKRNSKISTPGSRQRVS